MYSRQDVFNKYYKSDIFNTSQSDSKSRRTKALIRPNYPTLESTKEDLFNVGKEERIRRRNKYQNEPENITGLSLSVDRRKKNYDRIYGSDIFNQRSASEERRKGIKLIPNTTQKSNCFDEMKDNDEYIKDLQYYTETHRGKKKEFNPDFSMKYVAPQERYYKHHYEVHGNVVLPESDYYEHKNNEERKNNYIKNKQNLNNYNPKRSESEGSRREIRYVRQKKNDMEEKRPFVDLSIHPRNNAKINKQIQYESHIFQNGDQNKNFNEQIKEIDDRIEQERKRRTYNRNVMPYRRDQSNKDRKLFGSVDSRWARINIDWTSPEAEIMYGRTYTEEIRKAYGPRGPSAYQRRLIQFADSQNLDTLSGLEKTPIIRFKKPKKEEVINSETSRKIDDFVHTIPDLNEGQRLGIRMKASVLDVKNDEEFKTKSKLINDFYRKKPRLHKEREITGKVNDRKENEKINKLDGEIRDKGYHNFVLTYATRGNQFDKLDDYEIKNMFAKKGIQIYDVKKNPFDKGGYNQMTFKVKGSDVNNQISNKVKLVKDDLIKKNYKINIEKEKPKSNRKNPKNLLGGTRGKAIIMIEPSTTIKENKYTTMPKEMMERKGFTRAWEGLNYKYKNFKP